MSLTNYNLLFDNIELEYICFNFNALIMTI